MSKVKCETLDGIWDMRYLMPDTRYVIFDLEEILAL
jgi:hypothetical protein